MVIIGMISFFIGNNKIIDFLQIYSKLLNGEIPLKLNNNFCPVSEIIYEKSGNNNIVYNIDKNNFYLKRGYGEIQYL
jgi:hypothetical protein